MVWLLLLVAWSVSLALLVWLEMAAGDDPQGLLDPDAPAGPVLWLVPPPLEFPVPRRGIGL